MLYSFLDRSVALQRACANLLSHACFRVFRFIRLHGRVQLRVVCLRSKARTPSILLKSVGTKKPGFFFLSYSVAVPMLSHARRPFEYKLGRRYVSEHYRAKRVIRGRRPPAGLDRFKKLSLGSRFLRYEGSKLHPRSSFGRISLLGHESPHAALRNPERIF